MNHATDRDLQTIEGLLTGGEGSVTIRMELAAALVDEIRKHRQRATAVDRTKGQGTIEMATILSSRTKEGMIDFIVDGHAIQFTVAKAKEIRGMLDGAIEAAVTDTMLWTFLTKNVGLSEDAAGRALLDFREIRQGSRRTVFLQ